MGVGGKVGAGNRIKEERNPREEEGMTRKGMQRSKVKRRQDKPQKMSKQLCVEMQLFEHSSERKAGRRLSD